jgi:hypothetical protein
MTMPSTLANLASKKLILGSNSPRRQELLRGLGLEFEVRVHPIEENLPADLPAAYAAAYLSKLKADVRGFVSASNPRNLSMAIAAAMRYATENEATAGKRAASKTVHLNTLRVQGEDWDSQLEAAVEAKMRELNAFQRSSTRKRGIPFSQEKKDLYDRGLCFQCKKPGHQAKDCSKRAQAETGSAVGKSGGGGGAKA